MTTRSIQELVPWLFPLSPGVVVCKDSGLLASFEFDGVDADAATTQDIQVILSRLDTAIGMFSDKPADVWWTVRRVRTDRYPQGEWPDPISEMIDDSHKRQFLAGENFVNKHYVSILLRPNKRSSRYFDRLRAMLRSGANPIKSAVVSFQSLLTDEYAFAWESNEIDYALSIYEDSLSAFQSTLSDISLRRLKGEEFMGFLEAMVNPGLTDNHSSICDHRWLLDGQLPSQRIDVGDSLLEVGQGGDRRFAAAISMKRWPQQTWSGAMDVLLSVPGEMVMSHLFRVAGRRETERHINNVKRFNELLRYPLKSYIVGALRQGNMNENSANPARSENVAKAIEAQGELTAGRTFFGWHNVSVVFFGNTTTQANDLAKLAVAALQNNQMPGVIREDIHLLSAYASTFPGQWKECQRWSFLSVQNMGDIAPIRSVMKGEEKNVYLSEQMKQPCDALTVLSTDYRTPFYFNFHSGALGHTLVVGPSRSGKSVMANFLLSQWRRYGNVRSIIFDKDYSCKISTLLQDGQHIDLSSESNEVRLNPLVLIEDRAHWEFLASWIEGLIEARGYEVTGEDAKRIWEALEELSCDPAPEHRRLMTIATSLPSHLRIHLEQWIGDRPFGKYFDNVEDTFSISNFCCIEMGEVMQNPRLARAFMDYAFYRIKRLLESNRRNEVVPTFIYLEECWFLLEDEKFAAKIKDWLKTFAKLTAHLVMATQSLEDIVSSGSTVFASMRDNIATRIFLPAREAGTEALHKLYRSQFSLTDDQIKLIQLAIPRENYFIVKPGIARMTSCVFDRRQLAALRSDAMAQGVFHKHQATGHPDWKNNYIEEMLHD